MLDGTRQVFLPAPKGTHGCVDQAGHRILNGGFKNITITNCVFDKCRGLALETVDGANLADITVSNLTMHGVTTAPIFLRWQAHAGSARAADRHTQAHPDHQHHRVGRRSHALDHRRGLEGHPVEDVQISQRFLEQGRRRRRGDGDPTPGPRTREGLSRTQHVRRPARHRLLFVRHARNIGHQPRSRCAPWPPTPAPPSGCRTSRARASRACSSPASPSASSSRRSRISSCATVLRPGAADRPRPGSSASSAARVWRWRRTH
ncbi:hypothetical protein ACRAWD_00990 [Caulobacter segnis]